MNRTILTVLFVLLIGVVAVGFYRGWFSLSGRGPDAESNQVNVNLTVDQDKMQADAEAMKSKAMELTGTAAEGAGKPGQQANDSK